MTSDWSPQRAEFDIDLHKMMMSGSGMMLPKTFDKDMPLLCPHKDCTEMAKEWMLAMCRTSFEKICQSGAQRIKLISMTRH